MNNLYQGWPDFFVHVPLFKKKKKKIALRAKKKLAVFLNFKLNIPQFKLIYYKIMSKDIIKFC
jgi:hypothetical protein